VVCAMCGSDVQELVHTLVTCQMGDGTHEEGAAAAGIGGDPGVEGPDLFAHLTVDRIIVFSSQPIVPHAGGVGNRGVDVVRDVGGLVHGGDRSFWGWVSTEGYVLEGLERTTAARGRPWGRIRSCGPFLIGGCERYLPAPAARPLKSCRRPNR